VIPEGAGPDRLRRGHPVYSPGRRTEILTRKGGFGIIACDGLKRKSLLVHKLCDAKGSPVDDKIKQLLKELGNAINESISSSTDVNEHIQRIRDEGYDLYVVLDATIGLNKEGDEPSESTAKHELTVRGSQVQFRINVNDLAMLRSLGIDPTRRVKLPRRLEARSQPDGE
jgi:hypothetical protein